jgi:hypothetical protein
VASRANIILGCQWGDEGKGRIVDLYAADYDVVARFGGGDNAGHSIVAGEQELAVRIVPSGVLREHVELFIGGGTVVNPATLLRELESLAAIGVDTSRISISDRAHVVFPSHVQRDAAAERERGTGAIGTTGRGIGPQRGRRRGDRRGAAAERTRRRRRRVSADALAIEQARAAGRRARLAARRHLWHLPLRHELAHDRGGRLHRLGHRAQCDRARERRFQGVLHARRLGAVAVGAQRRAGRTAAPPGRRVRHGDRASETLRLVRRGRCALRRRAQRTRRRSTCSRAWIASAS